MSVLQKIVLFIFLCGLLAMPDFSGVQAMGAQRASPSADSVVQVAEKPQKKQWRKTLKRYSDSPVPGIVTLALMLTVLGVPGLLISFVTGAGSLLTGLSIAALSAGVLIFMILLVIIAGALSQYGKP